MARPTRVHPSLPALRRHGRRATLLAAAAALATVVAGMIAGPAFADTAPTNPASPSTPTTVSADALPTPQINGVVWTQVIVGSTVFAGGTFSTARPSGVAPQGKGTVSRWNILSYNLTTGALNTRFAPQLNGTVRAIVGTSDHRHVFVGGSFTRAGRASADHVVELDATTGAVVASFKGWANGSVYALAVSSKLDTLYMGGDFTVADSQNRSHLAAVAASTGILRLWKPTANGTVRAIVMAPDYSKLVIGGSFTTLDGKSDPGYGIGAVARNTGALLPWAMNSVVRDGGAHSSIMSLANDSSGLYGSGYVYGPGGNVEGTFRANWSTGALTWLEDCHGDTYSVAVSSGVEYEAGHAHDCSTVGGFPDHTALENYRGLAFSTAATQKLTANTVAGYSNFAGQPAPSLLAWYPNFDVGTYTGQSQGPWSVAANAAYVVYGGEFTTVNGTAQQGLTRFAVSSIAPNRMGPQRSGAGFVPTVTTTSTSATVSWKANSDPDNQTLTYTVYRDSAPVYTLSASSSVWNEPTLAWTDTGPSGTGLVPGSSHSYRVRATDAFGNTVIGDSVSVALPAGAPSTSTPVPTPTPTGSAPPAPTD